MAGSDSDDYVPVIYHWGYYQCCGIYGGGKEFFSKVNFGFKKEISEKVDSFILIGES